MFKSKSTAHRLLALPAISLAFVSALTALPRICLAEDGQNRQAWGFPDTSRASMAIIMKQQSDAQSGTVSGGDGGNALVCGGGTGATATANSTCVILNNSTGSIDIGQGSKGNQTGSTTEATNGVAKSQTSLSDALGPLVQ